jgi:hypothetical protein
MKIGAITLGAGVQTTVSLTYLPSVIHFAVGTTPTNIKVTVLGDGVICDLDAKGIDIASAALAVGKVTDGYYIPLADGIVTGKNVEITVTNADAAGFDLFGYSTQKGMTYIRSLQQKVFAQSGVQMADFFMCSLPEFVADDELNITYQGGFVQKFAPEDLTRENSFDTYINNDGNDFRINNTNARLTMFSFVPKADEQIYVFKYSRVGNQ